MRGAKTGGRQRGTPNKRTQDVIARLEALGCDPLEGMAKLAMDEGNAAELRGRMYAELAAYCYPKRKAIEVTSEEPLTIVITRWANAPELAEGER